MRTIASASRAARAAASLCARIRRVIVGAQAAAPQRSAESAAVAAWNEPARARPSRSRLSVHQC